MAMPSPEPIVVPESSLRRSRDGFGRARDSHYTASPLLSHDTTPPASTAHFFSSEPAPGSVLKKSQPPQCFLVCAGIFIECHVLPVSYGVPFQSICTFGERAPIL